MFAEHLAFVERPREVDVVRQGFSLLHIASPSLLFRVGSLVSPYRVERASCSIVDTADGITVTGETSMKLNRGPELPSNWADTASLRRVRLHNFVPPKRTSGPLRVYRGVLKNWSPEPLFIDSFGSGLLGEGLGELEPVTAFEVAAVDYKWGPAK